MVGCFKGKLPQGLRGGTLPEKNFDGSPEKGFLNLIFLFEGETRVNMTYYTLPFLFINLGGEMMYILDQRLRAQNIAAEKAKKGNSEKFL